MPENPKSIDINPEFEKLSDECELLKEGLAALFADWEHLTRAVIPNIEAEYVVKIGTLQHELLQVQIYIQRTKREIDLIQAALNRGEFIDMQQVQQQLEQQFTEWQVQLQDQVKEIKEAQNTLSCLMSSEDSAQLRKLYRVLAKKLHPDVNPDQGRDAYNLWIQVQSAYEMSDLAQLKALHLLADEIPDSYDLPNSIDILKKRLADFKDHIKQILQKMTELKSLPIFKWEQCLENPDCIADEQHKIGAQIVQEKERLLVLQVVLNQLKQDKDDE